MKFLAYGMTLLSWREKGANNERVKAARNNKRYHLRIWNCRTQPRTRVIHQTRRKGNEEVVSDRSLLQRFLPSLLFHSFSSSFHLAHHFYFIAYAKYDQHPDFLSVFSFCFTLPTNCFLPVRV